MSYDFVAPIATPSWTQSLASGIMTGLNVYRQRKLDQQNAIEQQRRDVEAGWSPNASAPSSPTSSTAAAAPEERNETTPDNEAAELSPGSGAALSQVIGSIRQSPAVTAETATTPQQAGSVGPAPLMNVATSAPKTTSGMPAATRTGDAPNASDVRVGGMTYDWRRSTQGQAMAFSDQVQQAREQRQRIQAENDRTRTANELQQAGLDPGRAAAVADRAMSYGEATALSPDQEFQHQLDLERMRIQGQEDIEGMRERAEARAQAVAHAHDNDTDIDRYIDDATQGYAAAVKALNDLQMDPRSMSDNPADQASLTADRAAAQANVNRLGDRLKQYQQAGDARMKSLTGLDMAPTAPAAKKPMSAAQRARAQSDPMYRRYLEDQGYDTTMPPSFLVAPFGGQ